MAYYKTSEWVSPGHPDKVADCISEYILDRIVEADPNVRYAVEVQIKDNYVTLAGELTSVSMFTEEDMKVWTKEAVKKIGYTKDYQKRFGKQNTICADELVVETHLSKQSPNISQGVNRDAWGDQGIFFGYFSRETQSGQGIDYAIAKHLGKALYKDALSGKYPIGLDIKTQVTALIEETGEYEIKDVIVAIPTIENDMSERKLRAYVKKVIKDKIPVAEEANLIINGTGAYHIHGPIGDSGTTGRKLVVDFYGSRSRIGGGSPWTKDGSKADLTLNMFAYEIAKRYFDTCKDAIQGLHHVETEMSCCIGRPEVFCFVTAYDENGVPAYKTKEAGVIKPSELIHKYELDQPHFFDLCVNGLFSRIK